MISEVLLEASSKQRSNDIVESPNVNKICIFFLMTCILTSHVHYHILSQEMVAAAKLAARKEKEAKRREAMANKLKLKKDEEVEAKRLRLREE